MYFPAAWLEGEPRSFYGVPVHAAGVQLDYALKTHVRLTNAEWVPRPHDRSAIRYLEAAMARMGLDPEAFLTQIWSYNPFWVSKGYPEYAMPVVARPLQPPPRS